MSTDLRHVAFAFYLALQAIAVTSPAMGEAQHSSGESCALFDALSDNRPVASVVVGDLLPEEGGPAKAERSPLTSPFGVDFDSDGNMVIVELEGGRIHQRDTAGNLSLIAGDGTKNYTGDGGPASKATFNGMHNVAITPNVDTGNDRILRVD